jgi:hypothetical protein
VFLILVRLPLTLNVNPAFVHIAVFLQSFVAKGPNPADFVACTGELPFHRVVLYGMQET